MSSELGKRPLKYGRRVMMTLSRRQKTNTRSPVLQGGHNNQLISSYLLLRWSEHPLFDPKLDRCRPRDVKRTEQDRVVLLPLPSADNRQAVTLSL